MFHNGPVPKVHTMRILAVDLLPYEHSTRTRKFANFAAQEGWKVRAVTLNRVGRMGIAASSNGVSSNGPVVISYVDTPEARMHRSRWASLMNLLHTYPRPLLTLCRRASRQPAEVIFVGHAALFWIGLIHSFRYRSMVVINARERLGGVRTRNSLGSAFSRIEPLVFRFLSRHPRILCVAVAEGHAEEYMDHGLKAVKVLHNVPSLSFCSEFVPFRVGNGPLVVALVGSLYDGRGVFPLLEGVALARTQGVSLALEISGRGNAEFMKRVDDSVTALDLTDCVTFLGACAPEEVASRYARAHIATALYEGVDAANDSLSNKLFEGTSTGRPVLAGALPENVRAVEEFQLGWTCEVTPVGVAAALEKIFADREKLPIWGSSLHSQYRARLNWEAEAKSILEFLAQTSDKDGRR